MKSLQQVTHTYHSRGFKVCHILADRQVKCIRQPMEIMGMTVKTTARDEHVPEVERYIRTIKERMRAKTNRLPFEQLNLHKM